MIYTRHSVCIENEFRLCYSALSLNQTKATTQKYVFNQDGIIGVVYSISYKTKSDLGLLWTERWSNLGIERCSLLLTPFSHGLPKSSICNRALLFHKKWIPMGDIYVLAHRTKTLSAHKFFGTLPSVVKHIRRFRLTLKCCIDPSQISNDYNDYAMEYSCFELEVSIGYDLKKWKIKRNRYRYKSYWEVSVMVGISLASIICLFYTFLHMSCHISCDYTFYSHSIYYDSITGS